MLPPIKQTKVNFLPIHLVLDNNKCTQVLNKDIFGAKETKLFQFWSQISSLAVMKIKRGLVIFLFAANIKI